MVGPGEVDGELEGEVKEVFLASGHSLKQHTEQCTARANDPPPKRKTF